MWRACPIASLTSSGNLRRSFLDEPTHHRGFLYRLPSIVWRIYHIGARTPKLEGAAASGPEGGNTGAQRAACRREALSAGPRAHGSSWFPSSSSTTIAWQGQASAASSSFSGGAAPTSSTVALFLLSRANTSGAISTHWALPQHSGRRILRCMVSGSLRGQRLSHV